uniref:Reverse transcriptase domain-containing protein n=1 Tax=Tanacetum cinerariifolium TaxID=118510 RepID=A0A6L2JNF6_TANCI|nr:reverse transcriptase domain-containing protein [Tanacetum cinerariifolium]
MAASDAPLQEYCDKHYHQVLPIIAVKVHQEKMQQEKLKEVKACLNFEGCSGWNSKVREVSQDSESKTPNIRGNHQRGRRPGEREKEGTEEYSLGWEEREIVCSHTQKAVTRAPTRKERNMLPENVTTMELVHEGWKCSLKVKVVGADTGSEMLGNFDMFNSTLTGSTRVWFDDLSPESIDSYNDLKKAFLVNHLQQKKCIKDPVEIQQIKKIEGESTEDFMQRFKTKSRHVKRASECIIISEFMYEITNPELIKRLHDNIPKSVDEMMRVTTSFLKGEVAASNQARKKALLPWKQHEAGRKQNFNKRGDFRNQQRSERWRDKFTLFTKSPKEILALDKGKFKTPPPLTMHVEKRNSNKFCEFHEEVGHNTDECMHLKRQIEELIKAGKLSHLIKELKQGSGKDQPKVAKKGETSRKDKGMAILMVQPWQKVAKQRITQSFSTNLEISLRPEVKNQMISATTPFTGSSEEIIWPMGQILLPVKIGDGKHSTSIQAKEKKLGTRKKQSNTRGGGKTSRRQHNKRSPLSQLVVEPNNDKAFQKQIGKNLEVYVDDLMIKSRTKHEIMRDIEETFKTLREINMKLNPKKCTFRIKEGMFLGYKVNTKGIKVCPDKVEAMLSLLLPKCLKDVQKLNGKLASLNRFLSKSAEKSLPFFKTLKKCTNKSDFQWTAEAEVAFKQMKKLIAGLLTLTTPMEKEELIVYLGAAREAYRPRTPIKGKILVDIIVERLEEDSLFTTTKVEEEPPNYGHSSRTEVLAVVEEEGDTWMTPIYEYLTEETLLAKKEKARAIRRPLQENYVLREIHERLHYACRNKICGSKGHTDKVILANNACGCKNDDQGMSRFPALEINLDLLEERREKAAIREARSKAKMEKYYNSKVRNTSFRTGDLVYRNNDASHEKDNGKLSRKWEGPYEVTKALGNGGYKLKDHNGKPLSRT